MDIPNKIKKLLPPLLTVLFAAALIWAGRETAQECKKAVMLCLNVLIPSLFAFTAASKLLVSTGAYKLAGKPFSLIARYVFRVPEELFPVFIISQLAGYPIGASLINAMVSEKSVTKAQAEGFLCCCISPGPAYIMAVSAIAAPESPDAAIAVIISLFAANLAVLLLTAPFRPVPERSSEKISCRLTAEDITAAARSAAESMTMICSMVLLMAAVTGILIKSGVLSAAAVTLSKLMDMPAVQIYPFIRAFLEISGLSGVSGDSTVLLPLTAAMLCFGGLCVHMQIIAVCRDFSPLKALIMRVPCAVMSCLVCRELVPKYCSADIVSAMAEGESRLGISNYSPILSIILLIMTILILSQKNVAKSQKI